MGGTRNKKKNPTKNPAVSEPQPKPQPSGDKPTNETASGETAAEIVEPAQVTTSNFLEIDGTLCNDCYSLPDTAKIVHAVSTQFSDDRTKRLIARGNGIWHLQSENIEIYKGIEFLEYGGQQVAKLSVKSEKTFVNAEGKIVRSSTDDRSDEILITLYQADTQWFSGIDEQAIYEKIVAMGIGHVKKGLTQQLLRSSDVPNGNLYFILKGIKEGDLDRIPPSFDFLTPYYGVQKMWLNFRGKKRKCFFCSDFHEVGVCPTKEKIRIMEAERDTFRIKNGNTFRVKIYGDSTIRQVSQTALACDVDAMSGGTTGNVLNAIDIDSNDGIEHIIIAAGQNELNPRHTREEFTWMQKCKNERLIALSQKKPITILTPPSQKFVDAEGQIRERMFRENLVQLCGKSKNITVLDNPLEAHDEDGGKHPSKEQAATVVEFLHQKLAEREVQLILNSASRDLLSSDRYYRDVRSLYKFGCAACADRLQNRWPLLCDRCSANALNDADVTKSVQKIDRLVQELNNAINPPLPEGKGRVPFKDPYALPGGSKGTRERSPIASRVSEEGAEISDVGDDKRSRRSTVLHSK